MFQLITSRLILRDMIVDDWHLIYALSTENLVTRYQSWLRLGTVSAAQQWVSDVLKHNAFEPRAAYNLTIVDRGTQQRLGWIGWGLVSGGAARNYDFGYALLPTYWGCGYMTEALGAMLAFTFQTLGATLVAGECAAGNGASARVMGKAGLRLVAQSDELNATPDGAKILLRYALTAQEWRQMQRQA